MSCSKVCRNPSATWNSELVREMEDLGVPVCVVLFVLKSVHWWACSGRSPNVQTSSPSALADEKRDTLGKFDKTFKNLDVSLEAGTKVTFLMKLAEDLLRHQNGLYVALQISGRVAYSPACHGVPSCDIYHLRHAHELILEESLDVHSKFPAANMPDERKAQLLGEKVKDLLCDQNHLLDALHTSNNIAVNALDRMLLHEELQTILTTSESGSGKGSEGDSKSEGDIKTEGDDKPPSKRRRQ